MNKKRLLNVAKALRESKNPDMFTMRRFSHPCGTPACALGHYAARGDLQEDFLFDQHSVLVRSDTGDTVWLDEEEGFVMNHFDITEDEVEWLFGEEGCNSAATANEAAEFIEKFVVRGGR